MSRNASVSSATSSSSILSTSSTASSDLNPFNVNASFGVPCKPTISPEVVSGSLTSTTNSSISKDHSAGKAKPYQEVKSASNSTPTNNNSTAANNPGWSSHYTNDLPRASSPYQTPAHNASKDLSISPVDSNTSASSLSPISNNRPAANNGNGFFYNTLRRFKSPPQSSSDPSSSNASLADQTDSGATTPRKVFRNPHRTSTNSSSSNVCSSNSLPALSAHAHPELDEIPLVRVGFALDTFNGDPPQQIPARKPKLGNVKVNDETGQIVRPHRTLDASNPTAYSHAATMAKTAAYNSAVIVANSVRADTRRSIRLSSFSNKLGTASPSSGANSRASASEKNASLNGLATALGSSGLDDCADDVSDEQLASCVAEKGFGNQVSIDKPLSKKSEFPGTKPKEESEDEGDDDNSDAASTKKKVSLAEIYTRCCHLREILPIQATLRQLDGKNAPLSTIQLMNPRPTLIEVLAFADFLAVAPITALILDNVDLTEEMFKQIILALINAEMLFKLSLRNVNLTHNNWKLLCSFLAHNKWIIKLDLSLKFPEPGKKKIKYKQSEYTPREDLDWSLLTKSIVCRNGLDELNINSCYIPHDQFRDLILTGCTVATERLGVSCSDLQHEDIQVLDEWIGMENTTCHGIDLSGNLVISECPNFIKTLYRNTNLLYLSLNSCNLSDPVGFSKVLSETSPSSKLRFLDASYNPKLFPKLSAVLFQVLPQMSELVRIYLDHNNLSSNDIILFAEAIPKCKSLVHISLTGNADINNAAAESLAVAVKLSSTVTLVNVDPDILPPSISRRMSHYCMQNMEGLVDVKQQELDEDDQFDFEGEAELLDDGKELVNAVNYIVHTNKAEGGAETVTSTSADKAIPVDVQGAYMAAGIVADAASKPDSQHPHPSCQLAADGLARRAKRVREKVQQRLRFLIDNHKLREMPNTVRDKLIRLWYLDKTLEGVIQNYEESNGCTSKPTSEEAKVTDDTASSLLGESPSSSLSSSSSSSVLSPQPLMAGNPVTGVHMPFAFASSSHTHAKESASVHDVAESSSPEAHGRSGMFDLHEDEDASATETEDNVQQRSEARKRREQAKRQERAGSLAVPAPSLYRECSPMDSAVDDDGSLMEEGVDDFGVCVLPRRQSSTSLQARAQAREEGELHKMGTMFRRKQMLEEIIASSGGEPTASLSDETLSASSSDESSTEKSPSSVSSSGKQPHSGPSAGDTAASEPSLVNSALNMTGLELRRIYQYEMAHGDQSFEEVMAKVKLMSPTDFEKYFLNIDRMVIEQDRAKVSAVAAKAASEAAAKANSAHKDDGVPVTAEAK